MTDGGLKLVDTHVHLCDPKFDADRDAVLERARADGIDIVVEIADNEPEWEKARTLARKHPGSVFWSAGLHPYYADQKPPEFAARLARAAQNSACVAVGEIGLDYFKNTVARDIQKQTFREALAIARDIKKPVVIHCRDAQDPARPVEIDMGDILKDFYAPANAVAGVLHCYQGSLELAQFCLARGFYVGVDAPLTYPSADALRSVIKEIPLERLVLETDSPYLPPHGRRGERNEPRHVLAVCEALAALKNLPLDAVARQTRENAATLYALTLPPA